MAYQIKYIPPDDLKPNQRIGVSYPLVGEDGNLFSSTYKTEEQIRHDLVCLLLTNKGERYMLPDYGTNLKRALFENDETVIMETMNDEIYSAVDKWLPIVIINNIDVRRDTINEYMFYLKITYSTRFDPTTQSNIILSLNPNTVVTA